jgi:hypothetical protein
MCKVLGLITNTHKTKKKKKKEGGKPTLQIDLLPPENGKNISDNVKSWKSCLKRKLYHVSMQVLKFPLPMLVMGRIQGRGNR